MTRYKVDPRIVLLTSTEIADCESCFFFQVYPHYFLFLFTIDQLKKGCIIKFLSEEVCDRLIGKEIDCTIMDGSGEGGRLLYPSFFVLIFMCKSNSCTVVHFSFLMLLIYVIICKNLSGFSLWVCVVLLILGNHGLTFTTGVWQVDKASDPQRIKLEAKNKEDTICISALTGDGMDEFCNAVHDKLKVLISIL